MSSIVCNICDDGCDLYKLDCRCTVCYDCGFRYVIGQLAVRTGFRCPVADCSEIMDDADIMAMVSSSDERMEIYEKCIAAKLKRDESIRSRSKSECKRCARKYRRGIHINCPHCICRIESSSDDDSIFDVLDDAKRCPRCDYVIERTSGCNSMRCEICRVKFCWNCRMTSRQIRRLDYEHMCGDFGTFNSNSGAASVSGTDSTISG